QYFLQVHYLQLQIINTLKSKILLFNEDFANIRVASLPKKQLYALPFPYISAFEDTSYTIPFTASNKGLFGSFPSYCLNSCNVNSFGISLDISEKLDVFLKIKPIG